MKTIALDEPLAAPGDGVAVSVAGLTKRYGGRDAVHDLTFSVAAGSITGFLGPNGSGKSTTIRMIFGLTRPTAGSVMIDGQSPATLEQPSSRAGLLLDGAGAHPRKTVRQHLHIIAAARDIPRRRVDEVLALVGLAGDADRRVGGYSFGMRQRLGLATALLTEPEILVLDEPANGLDPAGIRWLRGFLRSYADSGGTVLISSHQLAELSLLADEIVVIDHGTLVTQKPVDRLTSAQMVRVRSPQIDELGVALVGAGATVEYTDGQEALVGLMDTEHIGTTAAKTGAVLYELTVMTTSLEDAFLQLVGEEGDLI